MKEDITTVIHQHDAPHQSGTTVDKDRKKKKAYVVNEELGQLQDQIANFDLLDDDDEIIEGDGHKHKHHHHHHHHHKHKHHHHHHHHHHSKNADDSKKLNGTGLIYKRKNYYWFFLNDEMSKCRFLFSFF